MSVRSSVQTTIARGSFLGRRGVREILLVGALYVFYSVTRTFAATWRSETASIPPAAKSFHAAARIRWSVGAGMVYTVYFRERSARDGSPLGSWLGSWLPVHGSRPTSGCRGSPGPAVNRKPRAGNRHRIPFLHAGAGDGASDRPPAPLD